MAVSEHAPPLQRLNRVDKLAHTHCTRQEVFLILKHHVIAIVLARCCAPRLTQRDFLPAVIVFQMFALGFRTDELATLVNGIRCALLSGFDGIRNHRSCDQIFFATHIIQGNNLYNIGIHFGQLFYRLYMGFQSSDSDSLGPLD